MAQNIKPKAAIVLSVAVTWKLYGKNGSPFNA
jgi:hypothetical protein